MIYHPPEIFYTSNDISDVLKSKEDRINNISGRSFKLFKERIG